MPQAYGWDVIKKAPKILTGSAASDVFSVPRNCAAMTVITPAQFTGTNWKLQTLVPMSPGDAEVWTDTYVFDAGTLTQLTFPFTAAHAITLNANAFGGGNLRLSAYSDTQVSDTQWHVLFSGFQN